MLEEVEKECDSCLRGRKGKGRKGRGKKKRKESGHLWVEGYDGLAQVYLCFSGALPPFLPPAGFRFLI